MPAGGTGELRGVARPRRRAQTWLFTLAIVGLLGATAAGFLLARADAEDAVADRAQRAANQSAAAIESAVQGAVASLGGAGVVLEEGGGVDVEAFEAFAGDLVESGDVRSIALIRAVSDDERADVEAALGVPFAVFEDGELVPAPELDVHYPVVDYLSGNAVSALGLDYAGDPVRSAAIEVATASGEPTVTGLLRSTASGEPGLAIVRPLLDPVTGEVRAFVSTGLLASLLEESVLASLGDGRPLALLDGEEAVFGALPDPDAEVRRASIPIPGREWQVVAPVGGGADLALAWAIVIAGGAGVVALLALLVVTERHQRRLSGANAMLALGSERSRAVQDLAGRLARALSGDDVVAAVVDHLPAAVGSGAVAIATTSTGGPLERLGPGDHAPITADPRSYVGQTMLTGEPAWLPSPLAWRDDEATGLLAGDGWAVALLPISGDDVAGVLAVSYPSVHTFGDEEKSLLETVGVLAARALARARRYDAEHSAAIAFQRAALPSDLPEVPGLSIAARYRPGSEWATVGGDWYDVLAVDDRRVVLVVGDVVGHGMAAAAAMGRLRTAFQTVASLEHDPGRMVETISAQVSTIPDAFCTTVVCLVLDVETRTLTWCRAGHPPPVLVHAEGTTLLEEVGLPPLGVVPGERAPVHRRVLAEGDSLVVYTDGVVERRGESLDDGFDRLQVVAADLADLDAEELADALLLALVPAGEQADDVVVLVVRIEPQGS